MNSDRMKELDRLIAMGLGDKPSRYPKSHAEKMRQRAVLEARSRRPAIVKLSPTPTPVLRMIARAADEHLVSVEMIVGENKTHYRPVVKARRDVAKALRKRGISYPLIGQYLGLHHTSVLHLVRT